MELIELEIGHPAAGAPCHCDAVSARAIWVSCIPIGFARPAGRQYNRICLDGFNLVAVDLQ